jgi:hypothetical protein
MMRDVVLSRNTPPCAHAEEMEVYLVLGISLLRDVELSKFS